MKTPIIGLILCMISLPLFSQALEFDIKEVVYIGVDRAFKSPADYFSEERYNVHIIIDEGTYFSGSDLWVSGENIIIEGEGEVNIFATELYSNVMWVMADNVHLKNLRMKHSKPGEPYDQNCSGRVLAFDNANNITVENCDLNGCGLAGLHDNLGNSNILVKDCYIHNNSEGAYTDIDGGVWQAAIDDHPVFTFENNRIENNGPDRIPEED